MSRTASFGLGASALMMMLGCTETPVTAPLRSLEGSENVAFLCLGPSGKGRNIDDCPDFEGTEANHLYALVTQEKGEVAVIDLHVGVVVDVDPSTPGFSFLRVGADPKKIVATPGGTASFVGVAEVGREGIYALPSTCIGPPAPDDSGRDLTTWPACSLPSAPGAMAILIDPPDRDGQERHRCPSAVPVTPTDGAVTAGNECPADLTSEPGPAGRRKLAVALPELGRIDIFDAQAILNREPGSFQPCDLDLEAMIPLRVDLPDSEVLQRIPADLQREGCVGPALNHGPRPERFQPRPSGFALGGDTLYVGDRNAPVIHVLDVADPCAVFERDAPLLPVSYQDPGRVVTTTELALSPTTSRNERFLYALDHADPQGSSVMAFDVTLGARDRTPLVRSGMARLPFEPPDRIRFAGAAIASLAFGSRDLPELDDIGVSSPYCNPDPRLPAADPGAKYRPSPDRTSGAAPGKLRGVFGFVALKSGEVMVIDVDDFDAACRRPISTNTMSVEDFRGCRNDPELPADENGQRLFVIADNGMPTVTNEVSCRIVQPHLPRSGSFVLNDGNAVRAPSLRALPRFTSSAEPNQEQQEDAFPKLLATDFGADQPAQVYVGTDLFTTDASDDVTGSDRLAINPRVAEEHSLVLPWIEPRTYPPVDEQTLVFEGTFSERSGSSVTGRIDQDRFFDQSNRFCDSGVQDMDRAREWGTELGLTRSQDLDRFARDHADIVQITSEVFAREETYWQSPEGAACVGGRGYLGCIDEFGPGSPDPIVSSPCPTPLNVEPNRDLVVLRAYQSELVVAPNTENATDQQRILENMRCCFPAPVTYRIRGANQWIVTGNASGFRTNLTTRAEEDGRLRCVKDCRPQRELQRSRVVEIPQCGPDQDRSPGMCRCDPNGTDACPACSVPPGVNVSPAVTPGAQDPRAACIFESVSARFAVYAGSSPTGRDSCFSWITNGGFNPLAARLTTQTLSVSPVSMTFVPRIRQLAVVDGSSAGLVFVSLDSIGVSRLFF